MAWLERNRWKYLLVALVVVVLFAWVGILHYDDARAVRPRTSSIVLTYRNGGGITTDVDGLRNFLREHHGLAVQLQHDCLPIQMQINQDIYSERGKEREMSWAKSDEGHICVIAREAAMWPVEDGEGRQSSK